jgi:uncharacterized protein (TIGR00159 family)
MALGVVFTVAQTWGLFLTTWAFQILWQVLIILLIILFQPEIRQVLEKVNPFQRVGWRQSAENANWMDSLTDACFQMGRQHMGALLVIERSDSVDEFLTSGSTTRIEGDPTPELLLSVFNKSSPLHDGAAIIRNGRMVSLANYLPLTAAEKLPLQWGTRHRAALGLTEKCDAWIIVVSEERGGVALARDGYIGEFESPESLKNVLHQAVDFREDHDRGWLSQVRLMLTQRWKEKLGTLALVSAVWLALAGQQDFEVSITVPIEVLNLPPHLVVLEPQKPVVTITARGLRKDASTLSDRNVTVDLDMSHASAEHNTYRINRWDILLPTDQIDIVKIEPKEVMFSFASK